MCAAMELVPVVCLCVLAWTGITSAADGPTVVTQVEKEDGDAILNCSFGKNAQGKVFDWRKDGDTDVFMSESDGQPRPGLLFKSRVSHFPEALHSGNASIVIRGTKVSDGGNYTCDFPFDPPKTRAIISLIVEKILKERPAIPGASPKPFVKTIDQKQGHAVLQCEVEGAFPKPDVVWKDSAGNDLPADEHFTIKNGKYYVSLQTNVTKTDHYRCVSTQESIKHQTEMETYMHIAGAVMPQIETVKQTSEWALLQCLVRGVSPKTKLQWKDSFQNVVPAKEPEVIEQGGSYDINLQTTVTKSDYYHCVATQENGLQTESKTHINIGGHSYIGVAVGAGVVAIVLLIAFIVVVSIHLKSRKKRSQVPGDNPTNEQAEKLVENGQKPDGTSS